MERSDISCKVEFILSERAKRESRMDLVYRINVFLDTQSLTGKSG